MQQTKELHKLETTNDKPHSQDSLSDLDYSVPAVLTVREVAELLRVPVSWVYERTRKRSADRIPGFRLGKYWRFHQSDVLAWLERQRKA